MSEKAAEPAVTLAGCSEVMVGATAAAVTVNFAAVEVPPPEGFVTVTDTLPAVFTEAAGMAAVS